jgi:hypothetical protein
MARSDRAGVGSNAVTAPSPEILGRIEYKGFPVLKFQISTVPSYLPANTLLTYVGMLQI